MDVLRSRLRHEFKSCQNIGLGSSKVKPQSMQEEGLDVHPTATALNKLSKISTQIIS